ncbi:hypothetical protein FGB62_175g04 [Gracilaria domingensis]|nr:hypothetical protein FGB62_175g04 [Gracilaria domingensis]
MSFWNLALVLFGLFSSSQALPQCGKQIKISGRFTCNGVGVPEARMNFAQRVGVRGTFLGGGITDKDGYFEISGAPLILPEGTHSVFVLQARYEYPHPSNPDRNTFITRFPDDEELDIDGKESKNIGVMERNNHRCAAYQAFYDATMDYMHRVGDAVPESFVVYVDQAVVGPPFTNFNDIRSNKNVTWSMTTAQHELAHIVRNAFDGDAKHFDADKKNYSEGIGEHDCNTKTNEGFAFNEGWAMYWASQCESHEYDATANMNIAGNVAAALRHLQSSCHSNYTEMVMVLKNNPGIIHSYMQFKTEHQRLYSCP